MPDIKKCTYYNVAEERIESREIRPGRSSIELQSFTRIWCTHEKSPCRENEKGVLECQGDANKCPFRVTME